MLIVCLVENPFFGPSPLPLYHFDEERDLLFKNNFRMLPQCKIYRHLPPVEATDCIVYDNRHNGLVLNGMLSTSKMVRQLMYKLKTKVRQVLFDECHSTGVSSDEGPLRSAKF